MFLRSLELFGFKTFAQRARFEFQSGITAVIGPNGSGKSNLADAVRWILTEPAGRGLRVRRSEDLIYSGGGGRAPAGLAEVILTLDNRDRSIDLDYDEVVITRRLHRTGESEFWVNGSRSRQRDVVDLLGRAGLAGSTYAVIGQGLIDAALSLRPEERRELIEEAADVRRHQASLDDARSRLQATMINVQRIDDIVQELRPRVDRLRVQAAEASEHRRLSEELAGLLASAYLLQWQETWSECERALDGAEAADQALEQAQHDLQRHRQVSEDQAAQVRDLRGRLDEARERLRTAEASAERERQEAAYADRLAQRLDGEIERTKVEVAEHEHRAETERIAHAEAEQVIASVREQLTTGREELRGLQIITADRQRVVQDLSRQVGLARREVVQTEADLERAEALEQRARAEIAEIESYTPEPVDQELEEARRHLTQADQALADLERELSEVTTRRRTIQESIDALDQQHARRQVTIAGTSARLSEIERRLTALARDEAAGDGLAPAVRAVLEGSGRRFSGQAGRAGAVVAPRLAGIVGVVAELVEVPTGYEAAIEAALGGRSQDLIVESWRDAEAAIAYLRETGAGRATFLPLDSLRPGRVERWRPEPGVHGLASEICQAEPRFRTVLDRLLGQVVVVEDLTVARRCLAANGRGHQFVTLLGDFVGGWGAVSGGSRSNRRDGLWRRRAERNDLQHERVELLAERESLDRQAEAAQVDRDRLAADLGRLTARQRAVEQLRERATRDRARLAGQVDRLEAAIAEQRAAAERRAQRQLRLDQQVADAQQVRTQLGAGVTQRRSSLEAIEHRLSEAERAHRQASGDENALANRLSGLTATLRSADETLNRIRSAHQRERDLAGRSGRRLIELEQQRESAQLTADSQAARQAAYQVQIDHAGEAVQVLIAELRAAEDVERSLANHEVALREAITASGLAAGEARRRWEQAEAAVEQLKRRIESDGISVDELDQLAGSTDAPDPEQLGDIQRRISRLRSRLRSVPAHGYGVIDEFTTEHDRLSHLASQSADLRASEGNLRQVIGSLEQLIGERFEQTLAAVNIEFRRTFTRLFAGGSARLGLASADSGEAGIEIEAQPPGKRPQTLALLSGGERAMTASALIFALLKVNPIPICVLDEVDAALDESNVRRFLEVLQELAGETQFVVITHNRTTVEAAETVYGLAAAADGSSRVLSLKLKEGAA